MSTQQTAEDTDKKTESGLKTFPHRRRKHGQTRNDLLCSKRVSPILSWKQFMELWDKANTREELIGLLHGAFASCGDDHRKECLLFLLRLADGHVKTHTYFSVSDEDKPYGGPSKRSHGAVYVDEGYQDAESVCRLVVARKAFSVLCTHFFQYKNWNEWLIKWLKVVDDVEVIDEIVYFLRIQKIQMNHFVLFNAPTVDGHNREVFMTFARAITEHFWCFDDGRFTDTLIEEMKKRQHRLTGTMLVLGNLDIVRRPSVEADLNTTFMRLLRRIIASYQKKEGIETVEHAAARGHVVSMLYLLIVNNGKYRNRPSAPSEV